MVTQTKFTRRRLLTGAGATLALGALPRIPAQAKTPPLNFVTIGDWGRQGAHMQREVGAQMGRSAAVIGSRFVISVGDNFYEDGVTGLDDPQWQTSFEQIYSAASLQTPWHAILGNHDYIGDIDAQIRYSDKSPRWRMPGRIFTRSEVLPDGTPVDFVFLDTNPFITAYRGTKVRVDGQDTNAQLAWLDQKLGTSTAPWKIVIGHHPIYTVARQKHDTPELIEQLLPVLKRHQVKLYINGHDHNLQDRVVDGIHFITCGAGSETSKVKVAGPGEFSSDQHGFMTTALSVEAFDFSFVNEQGTLLYQTSVPRLS